MLYLVNAVCFDAKWKKPYEKENIQKGAVFTAADGTRQTADLLWAQESLYLSADNTTGFMKYYDGGRYAIEGLLPNEGVSITDYVAGLTGGKLHALLNDPQHGTGEAAIPRFKASSSLELSDALKAMGVTDAFDSAAADLRARGGAPNDLLYVSAGLHKTYLELDENGTKAAAEAYMYAACKYRNGMVVVARCRDIDRWEKRDGKWLVVKRTVAGDNTMILHPDFAPDYNNGRDKVKDPSYAYYATIE